MKPTVKDTSTDKKERCCCKMLRRISVFLWTVLGHTHCALCYFHSRSTITFNSIHSAFPFSFSPHFNISSFILLDLVLSLRLSPFATPHHYTPQENRKRITLSCDNRFLLNPLCVWLPLNFSRHWIFSCAAKLPSQYSPLKINTSD